MLNYKYLILSVFLVLIISFGGVSASDDLSHADVLGSSQDNLNLTNDENCATFEDVQMKIDNADEGALIDLEGDFTSSGNAIHINKSLTINGHNKTTLDANKSSTFFYLDNVSKISVNGIKFINCEFYGDSVFQWENGFADEIVFTNCDFQDNAGYFLLISSKKATFSNCNFINNENELFMLDSNDLTVRNCRFIKNTDQLISRANTIDNCVFQENTAKYFDLIDKVKSITNSNFIRNDFEFGAHFAINTANYVFNNKFESNKGGYVIYNAGTVDKCLFNKNNGPIFDKCNVMKNSRFENNKGDITSYGKSVSNCKFINNKGSYFFLNVSSISDSYFKNNKECFIKGRNLVVKNSKFINVKGGVEAVKIYKCSFSKTDLNYVSANSIINTKFTKNTITIDAKTVKKCQFIQNKCKGSLLGARTVSNSKFLKNICGGSLLGADKTVSNCRFEKNKFAKTMSGNLVAGAKLLKKSVFKSNTGKKGSLVCDVNTVTGCTFKNNKVTNFAYGTVYFVKKVLNSKFINNKASRAEGGAIVEVDIVRKCTFKNNYALVGGAISTCNKFTIDKCIFQKNTAKHSGSAIYVRTSVRPVNGVIKNCKFIKNKAKGRIKTYDVPYKIYKNGTIFAMGDFKVKTKLTIKKCRGL